MKSSLVTLLFALHLLALGACSGEVVEMVKMDSVILRWSPEPSFALNGEVVLRNSGRGVAKGNLELICELDLGKIEIEAIETLVGGDLEEWREDLSSVEDINPRIAPLFEALLGYIEDYPDIGSAGVRDVRIEDPEETTYVFSYYTEVDLMPGEVVRLEISSAVPAYLYGRKPKIEVGALER